MKNATADDARVDRLIEVKAVAVEQSCVGVITAEFQATGAEPLPSAEPGAHVDFCLPTGLVRQYSLWDTASDVYRIAIQLEPDGRGGSSWLHANLTPGTRLLAGLPRNNFPLVAAQRYIFIAGGIGITPIRAMVRNVAADGLDFHLHVCTRSQERTPFRADLASDLGDKVTFVHDDGDPSRGIVLDDVLAAPDGQTRVYCCGPRALMDAVKDVALANGWPSDRLHFENFKPSDQGGVAGSAFAVVIDSTGETLDVGPDQTVLEVLTSAGIVVDSACEEGICGTCRVGVLDGVPDHRDDVLSDDERASNSVMTVCCSRSLGDRLVLDL